MVRLRVGLKQQIRIKATMKGCFQLLHDSPARRADFVSVTGSELFPLFFGATRWVEDRDVADRLLKIWVHIKSIMKFWLKLPKSKQPKCESFTNVNTAVDDELYPVKLSFFSYFASIFEPFLRKYQTRDPMIPYLYNDIIRLLHSILQVVLLAKIY